MPADVSAEDPSSASDKPIAVTDRADLESFLETDPVVVVEFQAEWCGPCQMVEPIIGGFAASSDATVLTVDVDNSDLPSAFDVRGLPTFVVFVDGQKTEERVGVQSYDELQALVRDATE
jgi:thioredoxin 1